MAGEVYGPEIATNLSLDPGVQANFEDFTPEQAELVFQRNVDISVKLAFTDPRQEKWTLLDKLQIGKFEVNGQRQPAILERHADGIVVHLPGYNCSTEGPQHVMVTLYDDEGRFFVKGWAFDYSSEAPRVTAMSPLVREEEGITRCWGYQLVFDKPLTGSMARLLSDKQNWTRSRSASGASLAVEGIEVDESLCNMLNFYLRDIPVEAALPSFDFLSVAMPGFNPLSAPSGRESSYLETFDCGGCPPPPLEPPEDPQTAQVSVTTLNQIDPEMLPPSENCCDPDICTVEYVPEVQCCRSKIEVHTGTCRTCTHWVVYRRNCRKKLGPADRTPPDPGEPLADIRPLVPCDGTSGWKLYAYHTFGDGHPLIMPTRTHDAEYIMIIGTWKIKPTGRVWCTSWTSQTLRVGDLVNPDVSHEIINGAQMAAEVSANGGAECVEYGGTKDFAPFIELREQYEAGCGQVLKIDISDQCFNDFPGPPEELEDYFLGLFYRTPKVAYDNPSYYGWTNVYWKWRDPQFSCAYICDYTEYADCSSQNPGGGNQRYVFYYLMPREITPFAILVDGSSPYSQQTGRTWVEDCEVYDTWLVEDSTENNWRHVFYSYPPELASWETGDVRLLRRPDGAPIDFETDFSTEECDGFGYGTVGGSPCIIQPQEYLIAATQADLENGVPFAVYYNWVTPMDPPWTPLQVPASRSDHPLYQEGPLPVLGVVICDGIEVYNDYYGFEYTCSCEDPWSCEVTKTGVRTFGCGQDVDIISAHVMGMTACGEELSEHAFSNLPARDSSIGVLYTGVNGGSHGGSSAKGTSADCVVSTFDNVILQNPMVSGDSRINDLPGYIGGPWGPVTGFYDGPSDFFETVFSTCQPPERIRVFLRASKWLPLENTSIGPNSDGQDIGNLYEEEDEEVLCNGELANNPHNTSYTGWRTFINPLAETFEDDEVRWWPPVYLDQGDKTGVGPGTASCHMRKDWADEQQHDSTHITQLPWYPQAGSPDLDDRSDIRRTMSDPFYFDDPSKANSEELQQPANGSYKFTVAWDGRQWLLDRGIELKNSNGSYNHDSHDYRVWDQQGFTEDGGTTMYPPGRYQVCVEVLFQNGGRQVAPLANVHVAYGGLFYDGMCASTASNHDLPSAQTSFNNLDYWIQYMGSRDAVVGGAPRDRPGWVTCVTSIEYSGYFHSRNHQTPWDLVFTGWPTPVRRELVILGECLTWQERYNVGQYYAFIGYEHYADANWSHIWSDGFYEGYLDLNKNVQQAFEHGNKTLLNHNIHGKSYKFVKQMKNLFGQTSYLPKLERGLTGPLDPWRETQDLEKVDE